MLSVERAKNNRFLQKLSQSLVIPAVALLCLLGIRSLQIPRLNKLIANKVVFSEQLQREVDSERLRLNLLQKSPSLGFDNLISNWVYIGFLQYFGDELAREQTGYELSPAYFEIIVERDPRFLDAYISLAVFLYTRESQKSR